MPAPAVLAAAQFAFEVYKFSQQRKNADSERTLDFLEHISERLREIEKKIDDISAQIREIPDQVVFKTHFTNLENLYESLLLERKELERFIQSNGRRKGRKRYLQDNENSIRSRIEKIEDSFQRVKSSYDPVSALMIAAIADLEFEFHFIIGSYRPTIDTKVEVYSKYLTDAVEDKETGLKKQLYDLILQRNAIEVPKDSKRKWRHSRTMHGVVNRIPVVLDKESDELFKAAEDKGLIKISPQEYSYEISEKVNVTQEMFNAIEGEIYDGYDNSEFVDYYTSKARSINSALEQNLNNILHISAAIITCEGIKSNLKVGTNMPAPEPTPLQE